MGFLASYKRGQNEGFGCLWSGLRVTFFQATQHEQEQPPLNGGLGDEFAEGVNQL